jgi:hypothetical protein
MRRPPGDVNQLAIVVLRLAKEGLRPDLVNTVARAFEFFLGERAKAYNRDWLGQLREKPRCCGVVLRSGSPSFGEIDDLRGHALTAG